MRDWTIRMINRIKTKRDLICALAGICLLYVIFHLVGIGCPIRWFTGIPCAGCGMTRAYLALLHLDLRSAFAHHPLFWAVPLMILAYGLYRCRKLQEKYWRAVLALTVILFLAVYLFRMLDPSNAEMAVRLRDGAAYRFAAAVRALWTK